MVAALAAASRLGILIKNTKFLESLADVDTVIFDKTGTVTRGHLELVDTRPVNGITDREFFEHALPCAVASRHPVSRAIVEAAERQGISIPGDRQATDVKEVSGKGLQASVNGRQTRLGRREWLGESGWNVPDNPTHAGPIVWLGEMDASGSAGARRVLGCLLLADACRPEAKQAVQELRTLGVSRTVLLTGDRQEVAQPVGASLEIDEVIAGVLPAQKLDTVRAERAAGRRVMMVGDGVNDALALRSGDVGVALGAIASDVALKSADVALMSNDLSRLPTAVKLARRTRSTIHANILIGAGISLGFVWLASIGVITPLAGAVLHTVGELFVIFNSARLLAFGQRE
jgi:Cd2+/Zn2+-exporting ATPase